jgi:hypothetical protein
MRQWSQRFRLQCSFAIAFTRKERGDGMFEVINYMKEGNLMKKYEIASRCLRGEFTGKFIFALLVALGSFSLLLSGMAGSSAGQSKQDKLEYGVIYSCPQMSNYEFKVISCDDKNWCQVFIVNKYSPGGGNVTGEGKDTVLSLIKKNECSVKGRPPAAEEKTEKAEGKAKDESPAEQAKSPTPDEATADGDCPADPSLTAKPKANDSMELKSKRAILARFQQAVEKGEKVGVGISFESFQIGPPRANLRGSTLYFEDAPVGAKVYPVKSKFTLCSLFSTEIMRDVIDGRYECFKDNFGAWVCATASGYRTINTKYEKRKKQ